MKSFGRCIIGGSGCVAFDDQGPRAPRRQERRRRRGLHAPVPAPPPSAHAALS